MRLRAILLQLVLLALLSAVIGGYVHYTSLRSAFLRTAEKQVEALASQIRSQLASFLSEQLKPVRAMAGLAEIRAALLRGDPASIRAANGVLDHFQGALGVEVCYLMNQEGVTVASSNRNEADSFVGQNFAFRPYFQKAMRSIPATYMALGTTSGRRGVYYSYPVHDDQRLTPAGVIVIKASVRPIEETLESVEQEATALLTDPHGIVFMASTPPWLFQSLEILSQQEQEQIRASQQFGDGPWPWGGFVRGPDGRAHDRSGEPYLLHQIPVGQFPGWHLTLLLSTEYDYLSYVRPFFNRNHPLVLPMLGLISVFVIVLYRRASFEVLQRRAAEAALRESEERFRTLYHRTPAMLHSIDASGRLVSVSDYWTEVLGYSREEVVGRPITDFMSPDSKQQAETVVIPEFLRTGACSEVAYQFNKKSGEAVDVLLSAIAERDPAGEVSRSLAVLVDVTEQKRVERRLKRAQELLRSHSAELERQVRERTLEISNILKYTPAVVSLKDSGGRYLLVNSRFEELFGVTAEAIRGKTDDEIFPSAIAERLRAHDQMVAATQRSFSVEEEIPQQGADHICLTVKFPLFDEIGGLNGVGSIGTDITALKQAQEQLRQLSSRILEGEERERAAVARELHDELGQILTALRMEAVWLHKRLALLDDTLAQRAAEMRDMIDGTIDEVRGMVLRLRPGVLDDLGLIPALEWVTDDFERRTGISCTFQSRGVPEIAEAAATAVYRISQETLTNVARHAEASRVDVSLVGSEGMLVLRIVDDGVGFVHDGAQTIEGYGLTGIQERAELVGGEVVITSRRGEGTTVAVLLPMAKVAAEVAS